jgi:hypothetical protein
VTSTAERRCVLTFGTFCPDSAAAPHRAGRAIAKWETLKQHPEGKDGFYLPAWLENPKVVPIAVTTISQKKTSLAIHEGNQWLADSFNDSHFLVELYDNPETLDLDESLEIAFLFVSRFKSLSGEAIWFDFRTLADMQKGSSGSETLALANPRSRGSSTTARLNALSRLDVYYNSFGLPLDGGLLGYYLEVNFLEDFQNRKAAP